MRMLLFMHEDVTKTKEKFEKLVFTNKVIFNYLCCIRLFSHYECFSNKEKWGDVNLLLDAIGKIKEYIINEHTVLPHSLLKNIYDNIPDTDNFSSVFATYAYNCSASVYYTLDSISKNEDSGLKYVLQLMFETLSNNDDFRKLEKENIKYIIPIDVGRPIQ